MKDLSPKYQLYDVIFYYIKYHGPAAFETIFTAHSKVLADFSLERQGLMELLGAIAAESRIVLTDHGLYALGPAALGFSGYMVEQLQAQRKDKKANRLDIWFKVIPWVLTVIFGLSTIFFNLRNQSKDEELRKKNVLLDSLQNRIKVLEHSRRSP